MDLALIAHPGTDWLNRLDDSVFDDYTTLFISRTDIGERRKGRRIEGSFHFPHRHTLKTRDADVTHTCNECCWIDKILSDVQWRR